MSEKPVFFTPEAVIDFILDCLEQADPGRLYAACDKPPGEFWTAHIFNSLRAIQEGDTLKKVFLADRQVQGFPNDDMRFTLGGHALETHHLHIILHKSGEAWQLEEILMCR